MVEHVAFFLESRAGGVSIERAILDAWGAHRPLAELVPVERVFAGLAPPPPAAGRPAATPYVALDQLADAAHVRTSSRRSLTTEVVRMEIYAGSLATALAIAEEARRRFGGFGGETTAGANQDIKLKSSQHAPVEQGLWRATLEWQVRVARAAHPIS
jgi:hypothetical protein